MNHKNLAFLPPAPNKKGTPKGSSSQKMANKAQAAKILKTRINKGKTRISAGFSLAEMERFELSNRF